MPLDSSLDTDISRVKYSRFTSERSPDIMLCIHNVETTFVTETSLQQTYNIATVENWFDIAAVMTSRRRCNGVGVISTIFWDGVLWPCFHVDSTLCLLGRLFVYLSMACPVYSCIRAKYRAGSEVWVGGAGKVVVGETYHECLVFSFLYIVE